MNEMTLEEIEAKIYALTLEKDSRLVEIGVKYGEVAKIDAMLLLATEDQIILYKEIKLLKMHVK
jgi:predicted ATP-grasp superfamily ATP-dependent carboligase